jgi:hypothetical protein
VRDRRFSASSTSLPIKQKGLVWQERDPAPKTLTFLRRLAMLHALYLTAGGIMAETHSPEGQIKEAIWTYGGWTVLLGLTLAAGMMLGYLVWGDAILLRKENAELKLKVTAMTDERDNARTQRTMAQEELGRCQKKLDAATATGGTPAAH